MQLSRLTNSLKTISNKKEVEAYCIPYSSFLGLLLIEPTSFSFHPVKKLIGMAKKRSFCFRKMRGIIQNLQALTGLSGNKKSRHLFLSETKHSERNTSTYG